MCEKKTIGILGGMGPLATADLFQKITLLTEAETDRDHIRVYIDSNANIPDRTAAILSNGPDPVPEMASALRNLEACGADCVIMPCNTAHYFLPRLNAHAAEAVSKCPEIHACTDVTGFGLLGHADEMARGSGVTIRLYSRRLPLLPGALEFAEMGIIPAGAYRNLDYVKPRLTVAESVQQARVDLISDPQTSGGLLVALPMEDAGALLAALRERDPDSAIIGAVVAQTEHTLEIV